MIFPERKFLLVQKNGYVTNDGDIKEDLMQYVMREYGKNWNCEGG